MAKRPDLNSEFAQKLLGDIRRRKEKLGFASSNTQTDSHKSYRGSRETTKNNNFYPQNNNNGIVKPNNNKGFSSPRRNNKQVITPKTSSQEIVPFRKDQKPVRDKIDVSMALALALSKTGKLQNIELLSRTKIGTDFVTHRGSIQFSNSNRQFVPNGNGRNGNQYLFLPDFGVDKLNEMINVYTRNRNFRDLEECLNMLIMMQDAQDYMVGSKSNNNKVLLLKDKEDEQKESQNKSKNKNKLEKNGSNSRQISGNRGVNTKKENNLLGVTNSRNYDKYNCNNSHKMNSEYNMKRMPGLVARLMGLEELPQPVKSKVEIKEVEMDVKNEILHEKYVKNRENIERIITREEKVNFMMPPSKCETKLEKITRNYIDSKRGFIEKSATNREKKQPKKIEEKAQILREKKLVAKTSVDMKLKNGDKSYKKNISKKNTTIAPNKIAEKFECVDKNMRKKGSNRNYFHKKNDSSAISGSEVNNTKCDKGFENGCKISEKFIEIDQNLKEIKKKITEEFEAKLEILEENGAKKDASNDTKISDDQIINTETINSEEIMSTDIDAHQIIQVPILKEQDLKLQDSVNELTGRDSCNYTNKSRNLYSDEDSLTEDQILLRETLLKDTQFFDFAQKNFKFEIPLHTVEFLEITKTPLEKETNRPLLHTVHEILERKGERHDLICTNFKLQSLNSLIKELDSDLKSLKFQFDCKMVESLHNMLEREIGGRNPDSNCMWEFGWNSKYFARFEKFEIAKDLEKHLVSGLITELTKDLIEEIILV